MCIYVYVHVHTCPHFLYSCMYMYMYMYMCMYIVCVHVNVHVCVYFTSFAVPLPFLSPAGGRGGGGMEAGALMQEVQDNTQHFSKNGEPLAHVYVCSTYMYIHVHVHVHVCVYPVCTAVYLYMLADVFPCLVFSSSLTVSSHLLALLSFLQSLGLWCAISMNFHVEM